MEFHYHESGVLQISLEELSGVVLEHLGYHRFHVEGEGSKTQRAPSFHCDSEYSC